jgi:GNAT superfamily N-acetyltransferase
VLEPWIGVPGDGNEYDRRIMGRSQPDLRRTLGSAGRLWAAPEHHQVADDWWIACSGQLNVNYNVAVCQSSDPDILLEHCLQPVLDLGRPGIIMLAGPGLATAQRLAEIGWVGVGALPLMTLTERRGHDSDGKGVRELSGQDLPAARALLVDTYGLDDASALAAVPDRLVEGDDMGAWGLFDGTTLASCFTGVVEDGLFVVWSMATRPDSQGHGYGRRLLHTVLGWQLANGVAGSLLQSSVVGRKLYLGLGFEEVEYWQLWSRPRWVMANA